MTASQTRATNRGTRRTTAARRRATRGGLPCRIELEPLPRSAGPVGECGQPFRVMRVGQDVRFTRVFGQFAVGNAVDDEPHGRDGDRVRARRATLGPARSRRRDRSRTARTSCRSCRPSSRPRDTRSPPGSRATGRGRRRKPDAPASCQSARNSPSK